jgi:hypothetical protein
LAAKDRKGRKGRKGGVAAAVPAAEYLVVKLDFHDVNHLRGMIGPMKNSKARKRADLNLPADRIFHGRGAGRERSVLEPIQPITKLSAP